MLNAGSRKQPEIAIAKGFGGGLGFNGWQEESSGHYCVSWLIKGGLDATTLPGWLTTTVVILAFLSFQINHPGTVVTHRELLLDAYAFKLHSSTAIHRGQHYQCPQR